MREIIKRCLADDGQAWAELWEIYDHIAAQPVRRLLMRAGFDATEADDMAIEIFQSLHENQCRRLRSFRGGSKLQLQSWLVRLSINFTRNWIEQHWRARKHERQAVKGHPKPRRDAPTEEDVRSLLEDLEGVLTLEDVNRLRMLTHLEEAPAQTSSPPEAAERVSGRTERRRKQELERKIREHLGLRARRKRKQPARRKPDEEV